MERTLKPTTPTQRELRGSLHTASMRPALVATYPSASWAGSPALEGSETPIRHFDGSVNQADKHAPGGREVLTLT